MAWFAQRSVTATPLTQESLWSRELREGGDEPDEVRMVGKDGVLPERSERFSASVLMSDRT